jgi:hypothetical protein
MLGHLEALTQRGDIACVHCGFSAKTHDQVMVLLADARIATF